MWQKRYGIMRGKEESMGKDVTWDGMMFVLIALWLTTVVLLLSAPRKPVVRWLSGVTFCGGSGAVAAIVGDMLRPYVKAHGGSISLDRLLHVVEMSASCMSYYGLPYMFVMFAVHYHGRFVPPVLVRKLPYGLLLPFVAMLPFAPLYPVSFPLLAVWAVPYILFGAFLVLASKEQHSAQRRARVLTNIAVLPAVLFALVMNYVLPCFGVFELWRYNTWSIAFAFLMFLIAIFKYGFLGVQLLIQRRQLDLTIRAVTSGTAILNHAIKNDLGKIKLFGDKINRQAMNDGDAELAEDIRVVMAAAQHIQDMIHRVHDQTQDLLLRPSVNRLSELIDEALVGLEPVMQDKVTVSRDHDGDGDIVGDRAQLLETLNNIIRNAMEAMPDGGALSIKLLRTKKMHLVEIADTGRGIEKHHLGKVLEPFFTTKGGSKSNFGLGLAYCYQVMKKHGGTLELHSEPGKGTRVYLHFPRKTKLDAASILPVGRQEKERRMNVVDHTRHDR